MWWVPLWCCSMVAAPGQPCDHEGKQWALQCVVLAEFFQYKYQSLHKIVHTLVQIGSLRWFRPLNDVTGGKAFRIPKGQLLGETAPVS